MGAGKMDDALIRDALTDAFGGYYMGITAENIAEDWGLTRECWTSLQHGDVSRRHRKPLQRASSRTRLLRWK